MNPLIFQSDFGLQDGAVSAMHGVSVCVSPDIKIFNLTHDIEPYNVWDASYRLVQTINYWPPSSVFVSVVDPGVGTDRRSVVAKTTSSHIIVTPDNGTLTHIKQKIGIEEIRQIDETVHKREGNEASYTFHGRDVYAYVGARLASNQISFEEIGKKLEISSIKELPTIDPMCSANKVTGIIDVLDVRFGSLWSNIPRSLFEKLNISFGSKAEITISYNQRVLYQNTMHYARSFADVFIGEPLLYVNSLDCMAVAINQGSFAKAYNISTGNYWSITIGGLK